MKENHGVPTQTETSRYIALILRHKPQVIGIRLDAHGWANVEELIAGVSKTHPLDMALLEKIVSEDSKQRYSFSPDKTRIRANQGHSIGVDVELKKMDPPEILYHGTGKKFVESIDREGLRAKSRLYVHLSSNLETAVTVGKRHGEPCVYVVDTAGMKEEGYEFYLSKNNVWLTKSVPVRFLSKLDNTQK